MEGDNSKHVIHLLTKALNVRVTKKGISEEFERHPDNSSLLAISDILNTWQIPNAAYSLDFDRLLEVPLPFVTHLSGKQFVLVTHFDEQFVVISNENLTGHKMPVDKFKDSYNGIILFAETLLTSGESEYHRNRRKEVVENYRIPAVIIGVAIIFILQMLLNYTTSGKSGWLSSVLMLIKIGGVVTTVLLLIQSIDSNNPLVQKLCKGRISGCFSILSSKAAKITEELSLAEAGFFYFTGSWLILLFNFNSLGVFSILAGFNLICLPYTIYSIIFQLKLKKWCPLCCAILIFLWLEFFIYLSFFVARPLGYPSTSEWLSIVVCLVSPVLLWIFMKPYLLGNAQLQPLKQQLRNFKYNVDLFTKILHGQPRYGLLDEESSIVFGNREAETTITLVSNPFCLPCAGAHKAVDQLLSIKENLKMQVIFYTNYEDDIRAKVAGHFMALKSKNDDVMLKQAMNDWYSHLGKNFDSWAKSYPIDQALNVKTSLTSQDDWCKLADIEHTPTILINGRTLPSPYKIEDLIYLV